MSIWKTIKDEDDVDYDGRYDTICVYVGEEQGDAFYLEIPMEFINKAIEREERED